MIRPFTAICMLMAAGSGLYLYQQKHKSQVLERQIIETVNKTVSAQKRVLFLTAEWDLLNDPERLAKLSDQFLKLRTMNPAQFAALDDLATRLPQPRALPVVPDRSTEEPGEADPVAEAPLPIPPMLVPPPSGAPVAPSAPVVARPAAPGATPAPPATASAAPSRSPAPAQPAVAAARPSTPTAPAARPMLAAQPAGPAASGASALGMARGGSAPPAPVPISASNNVFPTGGN